MRLSAGLRAPRRSKEGGLCRVFTLRTRLLHASHQGPQAQVIAVMDAAMTLPPSSRSKTITCGICELPPFSQPFALCALGRIAHPRL